MTWWILWRVPVFALVVLAAWWFGVRPMLSDQGWVAGPEDFALCGAQGTGRAGCVIDGDTIIVGEGADRRRIRLAGFDAPELAGQCEAERKLAILARMAVHEWLNAGAFEWDGADTPPRDKYGRELRSIRRVGPGGASDYLAETMITRGLAAPTDRGGKRQDWCAAG